MSNVQGVPVCLSVCLSGTKNYNNTGYASHWFTYLPAPLCGPLVVFVIILTGVLGEFLIK